MDPFINRGINDCVLASTDPDQHIDHNNPPEHNHGLLTKLEAHAEEQKRIMLLLGHGVPFTGVKYILLRNRLCCKQLTTSVVSSLKVLAKLRKSNRTDLFGRIMVIVVRALRKHINALCDYGVIRETRSEFMSKDTASKADMLAAVRVIEQITPSSLKSLRTLHTQYANDCPCSKRRDRRILKQWKTALDAIQAAIDQFVSRSGVFNF